MRKDIHPPYFPKAVFECVCGKEIKVGSTKEKMSIEICDNCHPFYTGQDKVLDTAGRVEKFKAKRASAKSEKIKSLAEKKADKKKKRESSKKES
ncbi:MAG: 50S ribosomal protein L31 [Candidatus Paceibacterota bacterium]|nr:MAG: 50S ribosomal protein L31 [Candidatus Paceibacterota bacterium]